MPLEYLDDLGRASAIKLGRDAKRAYSKDIRHVESFTFWNGDAQTLALWQHQRSAVALGLAYLRADRILVNENNVTEAALIKLPTGTGKSGVIAILSRCVPHVRKVLVLTPRAALAEQMLDDIGHRFWNHLGFEAPDGSAWHADQTVAGRPIDPCYVQHLLPNRLTLSRILHQADRERVVLVGTFQALDEIRRTVDRANRLLRRGEEIDEDTLAKLELYEPMLAFLRTFDLVVVDEGHYEPAPSWSRSVRTLDRPTILLSATPFRNDYKFFRVRGRFLFNLAFHEAEESKIIRGVEFWDAASGRPLSTPDQTATASLTVSKPLPETSGDEGSDSEEAQSLTEEDRRQVEEFVDMLESQLPKAWDQAAKYKAPADRAIIRAVGYEILELIHARVETRLGIESVLVHERVKDRKEAPKGHFRTVAAARKMHPRAQIWLHESKLLEGIDDSRFSVVAIFQEFGNARQLVQQIGRVIRSTDPSRKEQQFGVVLTRDHAVHARLVETWRRYLEFETYCSANVEHLVRSEAATPERVLEKMPDVQYVDRQFRHRYLKSGQVVAEGIQLPPRASIFIVDEFFDATDAEYELEEAILATDRFRPQPIENLPEGMFGRVYYAWKNSPYLVDDYFAEWTLGVCVAYRIDDFLFVHDTEGIVFDPAKLDVARADRERLLRAFPQSMQAGEVVLTRMAAHSLDMSDRAIRTQATRTRSFETTFTDLLDPSLVPTSVYGFVSNVGRYLGIAKARISDASDFYLTLPEFRNWAEVISRELSDASRTPSKVFDRYAKPVPVPFDALGQARSYWISLPRHFQNLA